MKVENKKLELVVANWSWSLLGLLIATTSHISTNHWSVLVAFRSCKLCLKNLYALLCIQFALDCWFLSFMNFDYLLQPLDEFKKICLLFHLFGHMPHCFEVLSFEQGLWRCICHLLFLVFRCHNFGTKILKVSSTYQNLLL